MIDLETYKTIIKFNKLLKTRKFHFGVFHQEFTLLERKIKKNDHKYIIIIEFTKNNISNIDSYLCYS